MMLDCHTHRPDAAHALISVMPDEFSPEQGRLYAVGLHPWHIDASAQRQFAALEKIADSAQVVAIGETGLDSRRGAPLQEQAQWFARHIALAEKVDKPLVIHCVRTSQQVLAAWRGSGKRVPWLIHGFRGNAHVVAPLVQAGFYISFGEHFNAEALRSVPLHRLLAETDDSPMPIEQVVAQLATSLQMPPERLERVVADNLQRFLNHHHRLPSI